MAEAVDSKSIQGGFESHGRHPKMKLIRRLRPQSQLKINTYVVISRAVEEGINRGWYRAHKHTDTPSEPTIKSEIEREILNSLTEIISWSDE